MKHLQKEEREAFKIKVGTFLKDAPQEITAVCGEARFLGGYLRPQTGEDISIIIQAARQHGATLHAFSCGHNWGFGSSLPSLSEAYLVDLSDFKKIRYSDGSVFVEPGVTQGQLDLFLRENHPDYYFNVTGAGKSTSLIGNALERGIGYFGSRQTDLLDLEIILGNGQILKTSRGQGPLASRSSGLGPDPRHLFVQSLLGIVTGATIQLRKRPEMMGRVTISFASVDLLLSGLAVLRDCLREHLISSVPHVLNRERVMTTLLPHLTKAEAENLEVAAWTMLIPVEGPKIVVDALIVTLKARFAKIGQVESHVDNAQLDLDRSLSIQEELSLLAFGHPTDIALASVSQAALGYIESNRQGLDHGRAGIIQVTPSLPLDLEMIRLALDYAENEALNFFETKIPMSLNVLNGYLAVLVVSVPMDHHDEISVRLAKIFSKDLIVYLCGKGCLPYRLGLAWADMVPMMEAEWRPFFQHLKAYCDPDSIFISKYDQLWDTELRAKQSEMATL